MKGKRGKELMNKQFVTGKKEFKVFHYLFYLFLGCYSMALFMIFVSNGNTMPAMHIELLFLVLGVLLMTRKNIPRFALFIFIASFAVRLQACLMYQTEPVSDFKVMLEAAQKTVRGDFSYNQEPYFVNWAYQTGFVLFESFFLKIINSLWILKLVNCFLGAGMTVLIYKTLLLVWKDEKVAQIVSVLYAVFPFHVLHVTVLTNSHASAFFSFLGIYFLLRSMGYKENKLKGYILGVGCIAIGNIMRPEGIVFLVSIIALYVLGILSDRDNNAIVNRLKQLGAIVIIYLFVMNAVAGMIKVSGVNPNGLANGDPLWKFVLGFNYETKGGYSDTDGDFIAERQEKLGGDRKKAELSIIKERLESKQQLSDLLLSKIDTFWWGQSGIDWTFQGFSWPKVQEVSKKINISVFWVMMFFSAVGIFAIKKDGKKEIGALIFPILILANFFVYLLIEVQPRYAYLSHISVFFAGGGGMKYIKDLLSHLSVFHKMKGDKVRGLKE